MFLHVVIYDALYGGLWLHTVSCHTRWHHHITSHFLLVYIQPSAVANWLPTMAIGRFDSKKTVYSLNDVSAAAAAAADTG